MEIEFGDAAKASNKSGVFPFRAVQFLAVVSMNAFVFIATVVSCMEIHRNGGSVGTAIFVFVTFILLSLPFTYGLIYGPYASLKYFKANSDGIIVSYTMADEITSPSNRYLERVAFDQIKKIDMNDNEESCTVTVSLKKGLRGQLEHLTLPIDETTDKDTAEGIVSTIHQLQLKSQHSPEIA